jgi:arginine N-succinyltransferase
MLADSAKPVIGQPHPTGRAALRMLEAEGFVYDRYVDIFDGGPTVTVPTDRIRTVRESRTERVIAIGEVDSARKMILAAGRLKGFRACCGSVRRVERKGIAIDAQAAKLLEVSVGEKVLMVQR